jgi:hypothetical protein
MLLMIVKITVGPYEYMYILHQLATLCSRAQRNIADRLYKHNDVVPIHARYEHRMRNLLEGLDIVQNYFRGDTSCNKI